jgi:putative hydrolase of the HAD superfamily
MLFDFGGVLAEEGFIAGVQELARRSSVDPDVAFGAAHRLVYSTGYLLGKAEERAFWEAMRREAGIAGTDEELREAVLEAFRIRPRMLDIVGMVRNRGVLAGILSDQVDWLDTLNERHDIFPLFHRVFNSFHLGRSKRDEGTFRYVSDHLGVAPSDVLFIDDSEGHVRRARREGMHAVRFTGPDGLLRDLDPFCPGIAQQGV